MASHNALERVVSALNDSALDDALWPGTSSLIDEACGAKGSFLTCGDDLPRGGVEIFFARCIYRGEDRSAWQREYFRRYYAVDEHLPRLRRLPDSRIVPVAELFSEEERRTSLTYNEGFPRFDCRNGLNVRLDGPQGSRIVWAIADPVDSKGWSSSRLAMAARILPHLRQYVRVRSALAQADALGASMMGLLDTTRLGIVLLDRHGRIVEANDSAQDLLRLEDGLSDRGGELRAARPQDNAALQRLLAGALPRGAAGQGACGSMMVRRASSQPGLAVHVKPEARREAGCPAGRVAALVLIVDPARRARVSADAVREVLGLTPAEAEVAVLLAEGRTPRQIAVETGRSYGTVRSYLKQVFAKLGASRQLEAAQCVLALSGLPGAPD